MLERTKVEGEFQRLYSRFGLGLTIFSPLKMGLLTGKYNDSGANPPEGSRFATSQDRFANYMRDNEIGKDGWNATVEKVKALKVSDVKSQDQMRGRRDYIYLSPFNFLLMAVILKEYAILTSITANRR